MKQEPNIPHGCRPLRLAKGYLISADGRVFRAKDGKAVRPLSLKEATRAAEAAIEFDRNRLSRQPLGPVAPESLVYLGEGEVWRHDGTREIHEVQMVQWVRLPNRAELEPLFTDDSHTVSHAWAGGGPMPAVGNTEAGWYRLEPDGAVVVFHGASLAAHERQRE